MKYTRRLPAIIENVIKNEWRDAELHIEVIGQMVSFTGTYTDNAGGRGQIDVESLISS